MLKRSYVFLSLVTALVIGGGTLSPASRADIQKDKEKQKTEQKDKEKEKSTEVDSFSEPGFTYTTILGPTSYLGVYLEEVTPERAKELKLGEERGAIVMKVVGGSPAEKAGLKENDVIVSFNARRVDSVRELQRLLGETPSGRNVSLEIIRDGGRQTVQTTLTRRSPQVGTLRGLLDNDAFKLNQQRYDEAMKRAQDMLRKREEDMGRLKEWNGFDFSAQGPFMYYRGNRLGISVESLTDQLAEYFGVKGGNGVLVAAVKENSAAAKAGLKAGDVVTAVDGQKVESVSGLMSAISKKEEGTLTLTIVRNRSEQTVTLTIEKPTRSWQVIPRTRGRVIAGNVAASF